MPQALGNGDAERHGMHSHAERGDDHDSVLSEAELSALGCQGVSQLDSGVWHLVNW